jgi:hypothetical protein
MPGFDRTGPWGRGPMTGRGRGYCVSPGWTGQPHFSRGGGFGRGRGWRNRYWATGIPGRGWWGPPDWYGPSLSREDEMALLQEDAAYLERELGEIRRSIDALKSEKPEDTEKT